MRILTQSVLPVVVILSAAFGNLSTAAAVVKAGAAWRSIVPPAPTPMGGFGDRTKPFEGVHDEVFARALVLDNGTTTLVVIGSDLMSLEPGLTEGIRQQVEKETGVPGSHIMVSCAHNHSAPSLYQLSEDDRNRSSGMPFLIKQFSDAAIEAWKKRTPAEIGFHAGELRGLTRNRQQDNDVVDPQVGVVVARRIDSRDIIGTLFNFTGHPVILGSTNLLLSGEYPGAASRAVEGLLGGVAVFTQGAAGDVTVHRSGDPFDEIERVGRTVAAEVIKSAGFVQVQSEISLAANSTTLDLPARTIPDIADSESAIAELQSRIADAEKASNDQTVRRLKRLLPIHKINLMLAKQRAANELNMPQSYQANLQVMQIGNVILASMPGEIFVEYALELRQRVAQERHQSLCLVGYANGYIGYIVTPRARRTGGYEASVTRVRPDAGRVMIETTMDLIHDLPR